MNTPKPTAFSRAGCRSAFTLMEILLAVTILGLVMTAVYGTWNAALRAWKRGSDVSETYQRQRVVMDTLSELTKSAVFYPSEKFLYDVIGDRDPVTGDSVSFVTASDILLPPSEESIAGMRRVTISLGQDRTGKTFLGISNVPSLESSEEDVEGELRVISADVTGFFVRYRDPRDGSWYDFWADTGIFPVAIEYTVVFGETGSRIPPIVVTRAIDLPTAQYAMQSAGQPFSLQNTTNEVRRRDVDLSELMRGESKEDAE